MKGIAGGVPFVIANHTFMNAVPTPLMLAVTYGPDCYDLLVQAGADLKQDRATILLVAAANGRGGLIPKLLAAGANVNAADRSGETVLTEAVVHAPQSAKLLLERGANPNVVTRFQRTPLNLAADSGNATVVRLLLAHGAKVDACPPRAHTALYWARKKGYANIVALLQKSGATLDR